MAFEIRIERHADSKWIEIWGIADGPERILLSKVANVFDDAALVQAIEDMPPETSITRRVVFKEVN